MPMNVPISNFPSNPLVPVYGKKAIEQAINLAPNTVFARGTVLGQVGTASANDVQTLTIGGTPTGGTFPISGTNPLTGNAVAVTGLAFNASAAAVQTALTAATAFGTGNVTVTGSAGGPYTITFVGALASTPMAVLTTSATSLTGGTPTAAVVHTTTGRTAGTYAAYADANSDGTQVAKCLLKFACATDVNGNITYGATAVGGEWGQTQLSTPAYFAGYFRTADLVGLDAAGVADLGKLTTGSVTSGVLNVT
jgi:hypothetical protein